MQMRKIRMIVVSTVLAAASLARADLLSQEVDHDLFFSFLNDGKQDRFQKAFAGLGVHQAPEMMNGDEMKQLRPAANILWNREYELLRLRAVLNKLEAENPQNAAKIAKVEGELQKQPLLLEKAKDIYNKRVDDITMERTASVMKQFPSTSPAVVNCQNGVAPSKPNDASTSDSGNTISQLSRDTAPIVQANVQNEQERDTHSSDWKAGSTTLPTPVAAQVVSPAQTVPVRNTSASASPPSTPVRSSSAKFNLDQVNHIDIQDSQFDLQGTAPEPNVGVSVIIRGADGKPLPDSVRYAQADASGHFDISGYIREGSGNYTIEVDYNSPANPNSYDNLVKTISVTNEDQKAEKYLLPSSVVQNDSPEIIAQANKIISGAHATTDMDKAKAIDAWVTSHITYDHKTDDIVEGRAQGTIPFMSSVSVLDSGTGICYGYSELYAALARAAGLPTKMVAGKVKGSTLDHEWDEVLVDGNWIDVDPTWDVGKNPDQFRYFDPTQQVLSEDHTKTSESLL